jgi:hypothetical protein
LDWAADFLAGTLRLECEGHAKTEKHRTEVTEGAEGELDWSADFLAGTPRLGCENHAKARGPRGGKARMPHLYYFWSIWHFNFNGILLSVV